MAAIAKRGSQQQVRRSGPSPKLVKVQTQLASLRKRAANVGRDNMELITGVGAAALFANIEKGRREKNEDLPTVMDLDPALVYGAVLYFFGKKFAAGKNGKLLEAAGGGLLSFAAGRSVYRGGVKIKDKDGHRLQAVSGIGPDVDDD